MTYIVAVVAFEIPLPEKACHMLKGACDIAYVTVEKFVHAKKRGFYEVSILQTGISRDVGAMELPWEEEVLLIQKCDH